MVIKKYDPDLILESPQRRRTLKELAFFGGALLLPGAAFISCNKDPDAKSFGDGPKTDSDAFTAQRAPHYFVFYYLMGGWDITLATNPIDEKGKTKLQYSPHEVFENNGHRFGPAMKPLEPYMSKMAVVRGMTAQALNHPQARFQMATGHFKKPGQEPAASIQTILAKEIGRDYPLPNLSSDGMRPAVFLGDYDPHLKPMRVGSANQLRALNDVKGADKVFEDAVAKTLAKRDQRFRERHDKSALAQEFYEYAELARDIGKTDYRRRAVRSQKPSFSQGAYVRHNNRWGKQAHLAVEVIRQDLAPVISVGSGEFDAHSGSALRDHKRAVTRGLETVAAICEGLNGHQTSDGNTLLDRTTVVVQSEFSRQPWINELRGKHHWHANSAIVIGRGVKRAAGGVNVVGECDELLFPQPMNPRTGKNDRAADDLLNGHLLSTVLAMGNIDPRPYFEEEPIDGILA